MIEFVIIVLALFIVFRNTFSSSNFDGSNYYKEQHNKLMKERRKKQMLTEED